MRHMLLSLLVAAMLVFPSTVQADVAPPANPPGSNPGPGNELTQVRMLAETVVVNVLQADPPRAQVTADFTMRNLGGETENLGVRFPIAASDGWSNFPEIKNVVIQVEGRGVGYRRVEGPEPIYNSKDTLVPWAQFDVNFPPGQDVKIRVTYDLSGTGYPQELQTTFYYMLSTGAGWKDTIGSAEIILRLPYDANPQNVILSEYGPQDAQFSGHEVRWTFTDFEPTRENDFTFDIVKPSAWKNVLTELDNTERDPQDGEAWGRLGKAYKEAYLASPKGYPREDQGGLQLYELSKAAYEKAVTLLPKDGLWHAGYAELLLVKHIFMSTSQKGPYPPDLQRGLEELDLAYQLAPKEAKVMDMLDLARNLDLITFNSDGSPVFISLTATPLPPSPTVYVPQTPPAESTAPSATPAIQPGPVTSIPVTKTPASGTSLPFCGGAALVPLALLLALRRKRH
jgi:hypothetical protein